MASPADFIGPVNIGNPGELSMRELAEIILRLVGGPSDIRFLPLPQDDPEQRQPEISLAETALGWSPAVHLEDGLKETIAYFRSLLGG